MVSDNELNSFIQQNIDSFLKWDILVYFSRVPEAVETLEGLSRLTGKATAEIEPPLTELVSAGVLAAQRQGTSQPSYAVDPGFRHRDILEKVNTEMRDRGARLKLLTMTMESIKRQNGAGGSQ
ncbi:MAG TPA: hypothetical protein VMF29_07880 [Candidatus Edwardsbacteria bacterium]|nr:hypothetical protein [Candidatus Edwardsbacteria bacterium]